MATGLLMIVAGLLLAALALGEVLAFRPGDHDWISATVALVSLGGAVGCLTWAWRLLSGRERPEGGLVSPRTLRVAALLFATVPLVGIALEVWRPEGKLRLLDLFHYFLVGPGVSLGLWQLAKTRQAKKEVLEAAAAELERSEPILPR
jgi:hypothetical protein